MIEVFAPDSGEEEIWNLMGRTNALAGYLRAKRKQKEMLIRMDEIEAIMGLDEDEECCRRCGHPAWEE